MLSVCIEHWNWKCHCFFSARCFRYIRFAFASELFLLLPTSKQFFELRKLNSFQSGNVNLQSTFHVHSILSPDFGDNLKTFWLKVRPSLLYSHPNYVFDAWPPKKVYVLPLGCGSCIRYPVRYPVPRSKMNGSTLGSLGKFLVTD